MNDIERIPHDVLKRFPRLRTSIDPPENDRGSWFLDIEREGSGPVVVEWRPERGFGISTPDPTEADGFGPDEVYSNAGDMLDRLVSLIESGGSTAPPESVAGSKAAEG